VPLRVLLVDDSEVYRSTMELLLGRQPELEVVASVPDGRSALRVCDERDVDLVLLDYRLPGADGTELTRTLVAAHPGLAILCLTAEALPHEREAVLAAGAAAVVEKGSLDELLQAIRNAR
jgi:DNA-binding NarL/FixJ family response regulator